MAPYHLAEFNVARARGAIDDPVMEGFVSRLSEVNARADRAPGFVWRLQTAAGNATAIHPYPDERVLVNLSVWQSAEALFDFVYRTAHGEMVRDGRTWFERPEQESIVLWWTPAGQIPSVEEGVSRLERLRRDGPSPDAFSFHARFPAPDPGSRGPAEGGSR